MEPNVVKDRTGIVKPNDRVKAKTGSGKWYRCTQALAKAILEGKREEARRLALLINQK